MNKSQINRRMFLRTGGTAAIALPSLLSCTSLSSAPREMEKPNIVFILADDLGWHQLGCYGSEFYETVNIDHLARQGMRFTNAYAACHVCSPTRASILTGKYPARLHLTDYIPGKKPKGEKLLAPDWSKQLLQGETTIAETLKSAGYATGHFGKWHLNIDKEYKPGRLGDPGSQGFDDVLTTHKPGAGPESKFGGDWHHVREITERAGVFIERNKERPFFCYISHNSIHTPEIETKALLDKYANKTGAKKKGRENPKQGAMLETLDKSVGTILFRLRELDLERKTIVIFFSDNGQKGPKHGKPFRGSKGDLYEGGIREPLIIRWPGITKPGSVCDEVVISNDFFPTLNEIAGASKDTKDIDGISITPLLEDSTASLERDAVYWHYPHYHSLGLGPQSAVREGPYKLIEWLEKSAHNEEGAFELYDLINDPGEQNNLIDSKPEVADKLKIKLSAWRENVGAQKMIMNKHEDE
jgi:arylsulfatase A